MVWESYPRADASARPDRRRESSPQQRLRAISSRRAPGRPIVAVQLVEERPERLESAVTRARTAQVAQHARHVVDVRGLAVAMVEPGENAEHFQLPLHAHPF